MQTEDKMINVGSYIHYKVLPVTVNRLAGEIFARAHLHLITERLTSPRAKGDMEISFTMHTARCRPQIV